MKKIFFVLLALPIALMSCNSDDSDDNPIPAEGPSTFTVTIENVSEPHTFYQSGLAAIPVGATQPGSIEPGGAYEFNFTAAARILPDGQTPKFSFLTMFVQSNDLFFAPNEQGIALYDSENNPIGSPAPVNVTSQVLLWDAGTEVNEVTGGPNQKLQQDATAGQTDAEDIGMDENGVISLIVNNTDGINTLPAVSAVIKVTISYLGNNTFKALIENVSTGTTISIPFSDPTATGPVPMSPVLWGVHLGTSPFFSTGASATEGVENIAEDGAAAAMLVSATANTGVVIPLSPGVWATHNSGVTPLFALGAPESGNGLEAVAEDGDPVALGNFLEALSTVSNSGVFNTAQGASETGAIGPGQTFSFTFDASPGERLSLATMFVQSNDWFYSFPDGGISLFNGTAAATGDVTSDISLYDCGTEVDQFPGSGPDQVIRQSTLNTGAADANTNIRIVSNAPSIVPTNPGDVIKVTITAL